MNRAALVAFVAFVALVALPGCARRDVGEWVARGEAANREADTLLRSGNVAGARSTLQRAAEALPPPDANASDARVLRQDLYARLSSLELAQGRARESARWATMGLDLGRGRDVFTSNLLIARGRASEQLGDAAGATRDYHDALLVTEALLDQSLGGNGTP